MDADTPQASRGARSFGARGGTGLMAPIRKRVTTGEAWIPKSCGTEILLGPKGPWASHGGRPRTFGPRTLVALSLELLGTLTAHGVFGFRFEMNVI